MVSINPNPTCHVIYFFRKLRPAAQELLLLQVCNISTTKIAPWTRATHTKMRTMHFWSLRSQKVVFVPYVDKTVFLQIWQMGYKNTLFHTDFKNVNLTLVKSAPKNRFSQKTVLEKSVLGKKLFRCIFYYGQINVFKISIKSRIFYTLFDQFKGKVFIS